MTATRLLKQVRTMLCSNTTAVVTINTMVEISSLLSIDKGVFV